MKLGKLLAAGKSIMNSRADVSYRSSKQIYLPKFGSAKNPFKSEPVAEPEPRSSASGAATADSAENSSSMQRPALPPAESASTVRMMETGFFAAGPVSRAIAQASKPSVLRDSSDSVGTVTNLRVVSPPAGAPQPVKRSTDNISNLQSAAQPCVGASTQQKKDKDWGKFNPFSILRAALPSGKAGRSDNMAKGQRGTATQTELSLDSVKVVHNDLSDVDVEIVPIKSRAVAPDMPAPRKSWEFVGERLFGVEAT